MSVENIALSKTDLMEWFVVVKGELRTNYLQKENFLTELWKLLSSMTQFNKDNPLIHSAVFRLEHGDLIPRAYLILSLLYGSHSCEPSSISIAKDFIEMLDKELDTEEFRVTVYASENKNRFFPELLRVWEMIHSIYDDKNASFDFLPATRYYAYMLLTRSRTVSDLCKITEAEISGELRVLQFRWQEVQRLLRPQL